MVSFGIEICYYNCIEKDRWEIDINMLDNFCDENIWVILIVGFILLFLYIIFILEYVDRYLLDEFE